MGSVYLGKRPTLTFHSTPLGSSSLVQLSIQSEGIQSVHDQLSIVGSPQFLLGGCMFSDNQAKRGAYDAYD